MNEPVTWCNKRNILEMLGKYEEAIECFKTALELNPNFKPISKELIQ